MLMEVVQILLEVAILLIIVLSFAYTTHIEEELRQAEADKEELIDFIESQRRKDVKQCRETQAN